MRRLVACLLAVAATIASGTACSAGLVTHVDFGAFNDFEIRLNQAADAAFVPRFDADERSQIRSNVLSGLRRAYGEFDVRFQTDAAGATERIWLGVADTANTGAFGLADRLDYRNRSNGDVARVFTGNFGRFMRSSETRAKQIADLSAALTGTAAHELGHNLGLVHQDSYGDPGFTFTGLNGPADSGGRQDGRLMATGATGLSTPQREVDRTFSQFSKLKLEFANGLTAAGPTPSVMETALPKSLPAAAQTVALVAQTISGFDAANVVGAIGAAFESDLFAFDLAGPGFLTAATITTAVADAVDTVLTIFDAAGTRLGEVDDTTLDRDLFGGPDFFQTTDSLLYGLRIEEPGRYFARVEGFNGDTGDYELLIGFDADVAAVPEPGAGLLVLAAGLCGVAIRGRRRRLAA